MNFFEKVFRLIKIYFGFESDPREAEGWLSWQHLLYVTLMVALAVLLAVLLGRKYKNRSEKEKLKVVRIATVVILSCEIFKIVINSVQAHDPLHFLSNLPLFLCSIHLLAMPFAAFGKGRVRETCSDFILVFGPLGCIAGTYLAGNIFGGSPVLSFGPMVSVTTHCISGFVGVYLGISRLARLKKKNLSFTLSILVFFELLAWSANQYLKVERFGHSYQHNYMFFTSSDGTPFSICEKIVGGNQVLYTLFVALLYIAYLAAFAAVWMLCAKRKRVHQK